MISGIASLVEGRGRLRSWGRLWGAYLLGSAIGGGVAASILWMLAVPVRTLLPPPAAFVAFAGVAGLSLLSDLGVVSLRGPARQVPTRWERDHGHTVGYFMYGLSLGSGVVTFVPYAVTFSTYAAAALFLPVHYAALAGVFFGTGRAVLAGPVSLLRGSVVFSLSTRLRDFYSRLPGVSAALTVALLVICWLRVP